MNDRALDHALEAGGRLGVLIGIRDQVLELAFQVSHEAAAQLLQIDIAGAHHRGRVLVVHERQQQVLERCVFVTPLIGEGQGTMERLLEAARESGH